MQKKYFRAGKEHGPVLFQLGEKMKNILCNLIAIAAAGFVSFHIFWWAMELAYRERGYFAVGGEYFFVPFVFFLIWILGRELLSVIADHINRKLRRRKKRKRLIKKYQARLTRT